MTIKFGDPIDFEIPVASFPLQNLRTGLMASRSSIKVFMLKPVHDQMLNHVNQDKQIECGGVLVGYPFQDRETRETFVVIVGVISDISDNRSVVHFTVTPDAIARTREILERDFPGLIAVGWYHSHPGHGVFLSGQDMTIVRGIYSEPWNLAWVIDPIRNSEGIFYGPDGESIIKNISGYPIMDRNRIWIALDDYPQCVKNIQNPSTNAKKEYTRTPPLEIPRQNKTTIKNDVAPHRRKLLESSNKYWVWISTVFLFLAIILVSISTMVPNFLWGAVLISCFTILIGFYVLVWPRTDNKRNNFTAREKIFALIMIFSLSAFWSVSFVLTYTGVLHQETPTPTATTISTMPIIMPDVSATTVLFTSSPTVESPTFTPELTSSATATHDVTSETMISTTETPSVILSLSPSQ